MQRFNYIIILLFCLALLHVTPASAFIFDDTLVSIDGNNYTVDDFKRWWKFWNDDNSPLPENPDPYVDWLLLAREGQRMQLYDTPSFKRQTTVFLQSRTLLMLKYDAVDSKVNVTDADINKRYQERFLPRWLVQRLEFTNEEAAIAAWQDLSAGTLKVDELVTRDAEQGGPVSTNENWLRPNEIDPGWTAIFQKLEVGKVVDPDEHEKGQVLYYLKEEKEGDTEDLAKFHEEIRKDLWREQQRHLTQALLDSLRSKYEVKIDEERLAALDINGADSTFTDAPIITTNRRNVSEKEFMAVIRRLIGSRPAAAHAATDEQETTKLKAETVDNIIGQSITNWESLDRHYEEKEPFKWEYEFNYNHRLVLALEQRLFVPEARVTDDEIKQHYEKNIRYYTQPSLAKLYIIDETQGPIDQIWAEVATGKSFTQVLRKDFGLQFSSQEVPINHLDPEVKVVVDKLADDETSQIFNAQGIRVIVHLVAKTPEAPLALDRVQDSIRSELWRGKLNQVRRNYLDQLKTRSEIKVRQNQWKKIQKEFGGA